MIGPRFVLWLARATLIASATLWSFVGCSRQSEGERCDQKAAGDTDCNEGLKCIPCALLDTHEVDRCCPPQAGAETDGRCRRSVMPRDDLCEATTGGTGGAGGRGTGGSGGSGFSGGTGGTGGSGGSGGSGATSGEAGAADTGGSGGSQ